MRYRYEINDQNVVRVWDDENPNDTGAPFLYQPNHPDNRPWASFEEAQSWTDIFIAELLSDQDEAAE
jgi:hypothetical protein